MWKNPCRRTMEAVCGCGKKSPWERGGEIRLPRPTYLLSSTHTSKREGKRADSMCTIHRPQEQVCVGVLLWQYVCVPTVESC